MEIMLLLILTVGFIWSTYKLLDGFSHIRKYTVGRFILHSVLCATTGTMLLVYMLVWLIQRLS